MNISTAQGFESLNQKIEYVKKGLSNLSTTTHGSVVYGFSSDYEVIGENENSFFCGELIKGKCKQERKRFKNDEGLEVETFFEDEVIGSSKFFLHFKSGIIAYDSKISNLEFSSKFTKLFSQNHGNFFLDVRLEPKEDRKQILEIVKEFDRLKRITLVLRPTNPDFDPLYKDMDNLIKSRKASSQVEVFNSVNENGLNIDVENDKDFKAKLTMISDGYGQATFQGTKEGSDKVIKSVDAQKSIIEQHPTEASFAEIFNLLCNKLWDIINKKDNNESN